MLKHLSGEASWFDLYKAYEMMRDDIDACLGKRQEAQIGWPSDNRIGHFRLSAQVYRHAPPWDGGYTPEKAMPLREAQQFLQSLVNRWLQWRLP